MTLLPQRLIIVLIITFTSISAQSQWQLNPQGIKGYTINTQLVADKHLQLITAGKPVVGVDCSHPEEFRYYRVADSMIYIKGIGQARHLIISTNNENTIVGIFMLAPHFNNNYEEELNLHFGKKQLMVYNNPPLQSSLSRGSWRKGSIIVFTDAGDEKNLHIAITLQAAADKTTPSVSFSNR